MELMLGGRNSMIVSPCMLQTQLVGLYRSVTSVPSSQGIAPA
jgi:hypothetical protein